MCGAFAIPLLIFSTAPAQAGGDSVADLLRELRGELQGRPGSPAARAAWDKLAQRGPAALPELLQALDTPDTVTANWLRTAFDRILDRERKAGGKHLDLDAFLAVVKDPKRQGRVRRLALDVVEQYRPGTRERLTPDWLDDPEFRFEAVADAVARADKPGKAGGKDRAVGLYRTAFAASRDVGQLREIATRLKKNGVPASVLEHMGFLSDWFVIGPFDAMGMKGFQTAYPPEQQLDLAAALPGQNGKTLRWKRYRVPEAPSGHVCLVNLVVPLGEAHDAVAYGHTAFKVPEAREVEFRGAADDNLTVWVNGERKFGFEEYRNGVRLDRHRFRARLKAGVNTVLVKVCQAPSEGPGTEINWEFFLRVVDETGKGIAFRDALPPEKDGRNEAQKAAK
jgi:hypothetical protein